MDLPMQEKIHIDDNSLATLAIWLSGFYEGKGNLAPVGTIALENLWNTVHYLRGDVRFTSNLDTPKSTTNEGS